MPKAKHAGTEESTTIIIKPIINESMKVCVMGKPAGMGIILHRMGEKAKGELVMPSGRMTKADKEQSLKHDPMEEFQDSPHRIENPKAPSLLGVPSWMAKKSIMGAALDMPGATKAAIGRLCWVEGMKIPIFGLPKMIMSVVRCRDNNRTPDIRTRCIIPNWAAIVDLSYVTPNLNKTSILNLLSAAGIIQGWGDWRPEKGAGSYGQFKIVPPDDLEFLEIINSGGREAQIEAMKPENVEFYDDDTADLYNWFTEERVRRGLQKHKTRGKKVAA